MPIPSVEELLPKNQFEKPRAPLGMRKFTIYRHFDETGVSGTGIIAQGAVFADGQACIQWTCPPTAGEVQIRKWETILDAHVRSHPKNNTIITWEDGTQDIYEAAAPEENNQ